MCASIVVGLLSFGPATAQERPSRERGLTARDVEGAPPPEEAAGTLVPRDEPTGWRWVPRILLFVPRVAVTAVLLPVRGAVWVYDRYELDRRFQEIFFDDTGTVGLYPVFFVESGQGVHGGATFLHRDLFERGGRLRLRAGYGGVERISLAAAMRTGRLLPGDVEVALGASYRSLTGAAFYGYGNGDLVSAEDVVSPIDPRTDDTAVHTRTARDDIRGTLGAVLRVAPDLRIALDGGYKHVSSRAWEKVRSDPDVSEVYEPDALTGLREGLDSLVGEVELVFDNRRVVDPLLSAAAPSTGWLLAGFGGYQLGLDDDPSRFARWGLDAQRYIDLYGGDRTLIVRALVEGVTGDLDHVPFIDLPGLGGELRLRGYPAGRFRDRVAAFATVEYDYPIASLASGYLFTDVGRVARSPSDLSTSDLRVGFGGGIQIHTLRAFVARVSIFASRDGDLLFSLGFDPEFDLRSRRPER